MTRVNRKCISVKEDKGGSITFENNAPARIMCKGTIVLDNGKDSRNPCATKNKVINNNWWTFRWDMIEIMKKILIASYEKSLVS